MSRSCLPFVQLLDFNQSNEPLPGVLGNTGTVAFIFREQGIFSNYFQGTGELLTRLLGSFLGTRGFSNGEQGIKSKKVKGSWEHAPPPGRGSVIKRRQIVCKVNAGKVLALAAECLLQVPQSLS